MYQSDDIGDTFNVCFAVELDILGIGNNIKLSLSGSAKQQVAYQGVTPGAALDDDNNGRDEVITELVDLQLSGYNPIVGTVLMRAHPTQSSMGQIEDQVNNTPGILDVPPFVTAGQAESFYDIFFEIELPVCNDLCSWW